MYSSKVKKALGDMNDWFSKSLPITLASVGICLAICTLSLFWGYRQYESERDASLASDRIKVRLLADLVEAHLKAVIGILESYANRSGFVAAVKKRDIDQVTLYLSMLDKTHEIDLTFLTDKEGVLWANYPVFSEALGKDLSHRDWYKGVTSHRAPYVSKVFPLIVGDRPLASAIVVPIFDEQKKAIGFLATSQRLSFLANTMQRVPLTGHTTVCVIDGDGHIIYSSRGNEHEEETMAYPLYSLLRKARQEGRWQLETADPASSREKRYVTFASVGDVGWTVVKERTQQDILSSQLRSWTQIGAINLFLCLAVVFLLLYFRKAALLKRTAEVLRIETTLRESDERFRLAFNNTNVGMCLVDLQGRLLQVNDKMSAIFGYSRDELEGMSVNDLALPEDAELSTGYIHEAIEVGCDSATFEKRYRHRQGHIIYGHIASSLVRDAKGQPLYFISQVMDVTERKQAEMELERMRNMLSEGQRIAHMGTFEYIADTQITVWSEEEYRIYGLDSSGPSPAYDVMLAKCIHPDDAALLHQTFTAAVQSNSIYELEHRIVRPDDSVRWVYDRAHPYLDEQGKLVRYIGSTLDITERKRSEEALRENEKRYRHLWEKSPVMMLSLDSHAKINFVSDLFCEELGYHRDEVLGKTPFVFQTAESAHYAQSVVFPQFLKTGVVKDVPLQFVRANGEVIDVLLNETAERDSEGTVARSCSVLTDITERKRAEEQLRESEQRFKVMAETSPLAIYASSGIAQKAGYVNPTFVRLFGYTIEDVPTVEEWWSLAYPDETYRAQIITEWQRRVEYAIKTNTTIEPMEVVVTCKDGSEKNIAWGYVSTPTQNYAFGLDLTERKRAEKALLESEERFRLFMDNSPAIAWVEDDQGQYEYLNRTYETRFGVRLDDRRGKTDLGFRPPEVAEEFRRNSLTVLTKNGPIEVVERTVNPDGSNCYWLTTKFPFVDAAGNRFVAGIALDITERKRAEEALKVSEERLHLALDAAKAGTWEWDLKTNENFWSEELWRIYGLEPFSCEPTYEAWRQTIHPDDLENAEPAAREAAQRGTELRAEWRVQGPGGGERWLMSRGKPFFDTQGKPERYVGVVIDITDRKQSEIELYNSHQEKVALLKEVHHRVKNNLQIVVSLLGLQVLSTKNPETLEMLKDTRNRVRSMALLHETIYRSKNLAHISFSNYLGDLCKQIVTSYGRSAQRIRVETRVEEIGMPMDKAVPCGLLVNELVSNALKHAFPGETPGQVMVELGRVDGNMLLLKIYDDGTGLPPDIDPENTETLGLQLVFDLARQLFGNVAVDRPAGGGTGFRVLFPLTEDMTMEFGHESVSNPHR